MRARPRQHRHREAEPEPAEGERERDQSRSRPAAAARAATQPAARRSARRRTTAAVARAPARATAPAGCGRQRADDERAGDRLQPPDRDHEQHGEEERTDERGEDEPEAASAAQRPVPAPAPASRRGTTAPPVASSAAPASGRLDDEDRPPVEELGEARRRAPARAPRRSTATVVQSEIPASRAAGRPPSSASDVGSTSAAPSPWTHRKTISSAGSHAGRTADRRER
jgi:hypothetical protein